MSRAKLLITAGPTFEPIDDVRYIGNRSSGQLGVCLAAAGHQAGWNVTLCLGPVYRSPPAGFPVLRFETTAELERLLELHFPPCDVLIMAAAVADFRPRRADTPKLTRSAGPMTIELEPTPDLVAACAARKRPDQRIVGFALEDPSVLATRAADKLRRKGLDAIVANPLETMGSGRIRAVLYTATGETLKPPTAGAIDKEAFARWLIAWLGKPAE